MTFDPDRITDVQVDDVHTWDFPDLCDAYISFACYNGVPMTDAELEELNKDPLFVNERALASLF